MDPKNKGAQLDLCKSPATAGYAQSIILLVNLILLVTSKELALRARNPHPSLSPLFFQVHHIFTGHKWISLHSLLSLEPHPTPPYSSPNNIQRTHL
jgi:hypothetical protein